MSAIYKNSHFWTVVANLNPATGEYDGDVDGLTEYCDRCHKTRVLHPRLVMYKEADSMGYYAYLKRKGF